ncbi:hypothetical protein RN001_012404 [Aquatica leii]|uniref:Uncharacterized protein n=1 Tax=Aquatica leii TaxID=1421715 RepID=A0AAN7P3T9_9COLE|nr:hypothetical protein RN001_012404 [Aquatica leii]
MITGYIKGLSSRELSDHLTAEYPKRPIPTHVTISLSRHCDATGFGTVRGSVLTGISIFNRREGQDVAVVIE